MLGVMSITLSNSASLIAGIFGVSTGGTAAATATPAQAVALLKQATAPGAEAKGVATEQKDPVVITALAQFKKALGQAKDLNSALRDPRVLNVLLPAFGLSDQTGNPGLAAKALTSDPTATNGLLSNIDSRWKNAASALGLFGKDLSALQDPTLDATITGNYVAVQYQKSLDAQAPGMSDAIYFIQNAQSVTNGNVYNLMGDAILRRVATTALDLPQELVIQPIQDQASVISSRLPVSRLNDPAQVYKLAQRYVMDQASANSSAITSTDITTLALSLRA